MWHFASTSILFLQFITKEFKDPNILLQQPTKAEATEAVLAEYGFSSSDANIEKYFSFEMRHGKLEAIPKHKGLLKKTTLKNLHEGLSKSLNPIEIIDKKKGDEQAVAFLFGKQYYETEPSISVIQGNKSSKTEALSTNIVLREQALYKDLNLAEFTDNQKLINDKIKNIYKKLPKNADGYSKMNLIQHYHQLLSEMVVLLENEMVYFSSEGDDFRKSSLEKVTIAKEAPKLVFNLVQQSPFIVLTFDFQIKGVSANNLIIENRNDYFYKVGSELHFLQSAADMAYIDQFAKVNEVSIHESECEIFLKNIVLPLTKNYRVDMKLKNKIITKNASDLKFNIYLSEQGNFLLIKPMAVYSEGEVELFSKEILLNTSEKTYIQYDRDHVQEKEMRDFLLPLHPDFHKQEDRGFFYVHFDKIFEKGWYFNFFNEIRAKGISIFGLDKLKKVNYSPYKPSVVSKISSGIDWFGVDMQVSFGDQLASLKDIQKALFKKEKYVQLGDGSIGMLPEEWVEKYAHLLRTSEIDKEGNLKVSKLHFNILDTLMMESDQTELLQELEDKKRKLLQFDKIQSHAIPAGIAASLRPYQLEGYNWLMFLDEFGWGGCLADDMGLGKTLQMICFLKKQIELHPTKTNLVVLPTTLIFNWKRELEKFAPDVAFLDYTGFSRNKETVNFKEYNLILTTYGLVINDIELLRKTTFNYVVLDESQAIKNPNSQRFKAVCLLKSKGKIVMTGTPVENNTFDLYAQMSFTNPGLLGNVTHFQNHFSTPIDKNADQSVAQTLRKLITPFMLRRTKEQVAKDLPDKTEDILMCEMKEQQRRVYNTFRDSYREMIMNKIDVDGLGKSSMVVLDAILKLRQICNSPALLNTEEDYGQSSIKIEELMRQLTEKTGNHKVLVFSQFTKMLKLVEQELVKENLQYVYLDGQTAQKQREEKVQIFKEEDTVRVFLISLKAGGVGLNLTEADYVYLIDPWWNPAVEAQAIDRTHRIGQTKKVFAYKMICKDTIEEKVLQLQQNKKRVAADIISTEASFYKQLDKTDIIDLFS